MANEIVSNRHEKIVSRYFSLIKDLRRGNQDSVEKLMELWDSDGVFEFAGSPPVVGTYTGFNAIKTLYKNRCNSCEMPLKFGPEKKGGSAYKDTALGVVDTEINKTRKFEEKLVVGWNTTVGTQGNFGFSMAGSHTFTFKDGKISGLKVVVSPRPDSLKNFTLEGLSVEDIGRLSLAAWAVV